MHRKVQNLPCRQTNEIMLVLAQLPRKIVDEVRVVVDPPS